MSSEKGKKRRTSGGWLFLAAVIAFYGLLYPFNRQFVGASLHHFLEMGRNLLPALAMVFLFLWLFNLFGRIQEKAAALTDARSGKKGWLLAMLAGTLSHGPIYPWYPLLRELLQKGTRPALVATFLYARSIKLPWLPVMAHYFGMGYMVVLTLLMLLFSPVNGWLVEKLLEEQL